jgi:hypothetical protein
LFHSGSPSASPWPLTLSSGRSQLGPHSWLGLPQVATAADVPTTATTGTEAPILLTEPKPWTARAF